MLYHYTSVDNLKKIIESRELWLTNIRKFGDAGEYVHTVSQICYEMNFSENSASEIMALIKEEMNLNYACCFCEDPDNEYLWENYGSVNIGFSYSKLLSVVKENQRGNGCIIGHSNFSQCEYNETRQSNIIKEALKQWSTSNGVSIDVKALSVLATNFKKNKFSDERETRMVINLRSDCPINFINGCQCLGERFFKLHFNHQFDCVAKSINFSPSVTVSQIENFKEFIHSKNLEQIRFNQCAT